MQVGQEAEIGEVPASQGCTRQAAVEGQDLPCMYLAHHELESVIVNIITIITIVIVVVIVIIIIDDNVITSQPEGCSPVLPKLWSAWWWYSCIMGRLP